MTQDFSLLFAPLSADNTTLQQQLYQRVKRAILDGRFAAGARLPATRQLAKELQVSRNTVINVWTQLQAEGYLISDRQGSRITPVALPRASTASTPAMLPLAQRLNNLHSGHRLSRDDLPLRAGVPALSHFPFAAWRRALNSVLSQTPQRLLGYGDPLGESDLREAIAQHLGMTRGVRCLADQIVITEGTQQALSLCVTLLTNPGDTGWVEDPGYRGAKAALHAGDLSVVPIAVDAQGLAPLDRHWQRSPPKVIYTSPTHQYPTGAVMSAARRLALIARAQQHQAWIIEDDYDGDYHHRGEPIAAMQGMTDNAPVIYLGSFSKTLFPALRIGFMVLPAHLTARLRPALHELLRGGNRLEQQALARFIRSGDFSRHLSKMRRLYRQRQATLRTELQRLLGEHVQLLGGDSGMHLVLQLSQSDEALAAALWRAGFAPAALSTFYLCEPKQQGLVLGYGNTSTTQIVAGVKQIQRLLDHTSGAGNAGE
ncbi:PLP-dependent aminotransferase family protein [Pantoea sp. LMR881]|uniref:MocR-like pyridoxine biosynthesis transcription factor PdxR n=1 Tax=Pantoea sp. LMR881 TaxID=3014336 RepID=UPI0022AE79BE|nr:PLP-dependent aminotransferase family protein [Pantoea sp. LMR881]MCZ4059371.1 PLP-dependent aminotransferase family protein [Pantoea sp. LMR881]